MTYKLWYWYYRTVFYLTRVLPLDLAIARESARWVALNFASFTLGLA